MYIWRYYYDDDDFYYSSDSDENSLMNGEVLTDEQGNFKIKFKADSAEKDLGSGNAVS